LQRIGVDMKQDEIIDMAIQAGASPDENKIWLMYAEELEAFAKLVAAKEREACAKVCEDIEAKCIAEDSDDPPLHHIAAAIRARGEA